MRAVLVTHLTVSQVFEALPWAPSPEAVDFMCRRERVQLDDDLRFARYLYRDHTIACDGFNLRATDVGNCVSPFLGELPTCPTCGMLWEVAVGFCEAARCAP